MYIHHTKFGGNSFNGFTENSITAVAAAESDQNIKSPGYPGWLDDLEDIGKAQKSLHTTRTFMIVTILNLYGIRPEL